MPAISKIRFTNVVYEDGGKRYNDDIFHFDGENGAILLENGGGKTVFIQTALQAILPHTNLADRKIKGTLKLEEGPAHIGIEWLINEKPRRYALTAVTLFLGQDKVESYRFVDEYSERDKNSLTELPFVKETSEGKRPADKGEMLDYYRSRTQANGKLFETIKGFKEYIEETFAIIEKEWESIVKINSAEGGVEAFFDDCKTSKQLFERLLIPTVETAMAANESETFADTFATRRKGFKEYQHFQETIQENQLIDEKLKKYVDVFAKLDEALQTYDQEKKISKAYYLFYEQRQSEISDTLARLEEEFVQLQQNMSDYEKKQLSYSIALVEQQLTEKKEQLNESERLYQLQQKKLDENHRLYYSLKHAMHAQEVKNNQGRLTVLDEQIDQLDEQLDIEELLNQQETNEREIRGYFIELKDQLTKKEIGLKQEAASLEATLEKTKAEFEEITEEWRTLDKDCDLLERDINRVKNELTTLGLQLNLDSEQETIVDVKQKWIKETTRLDEEIANLKTNNRKLEQESSDIKSDQESLRLKQQDITIAYTNKAKDKEFIETQHDELKAEVRALSRSWELVSSLYTKQDSIVGEISNQIRLLKEKKEKLLKNERLAYRYVDDYQNMNAFFADRHIAEVVEKWKNVFDYVVTGSEFLQQAGVQMEKLSGEHYWPITLVTTADEKEALLTRVKKLEHDIQFPIIVLSNDEASKQLLEHGEKKWDSVSPAHWQKNLDVSQFQMWKQSLLTHAEQCKKEREEAEREIGNWTSVFDKLSSFFVQYSFEEYKELKRELDELGKEKNQVESDLTQKDERLAEITDMMTKQTNKISEYDSLLRDITLLLEKCEQYETGMKEQNQLQMKFHEQQAKRDNSLKKKKLLNQQVQELESELKEAESLLNEHKTEKRIQLDEQELYKQTRSVELPIFSNKPLAQLQEKKISIENRLNEHSIERKELMQVKEQLKKEIERSEEEILSLKRQYEEIDENLLFPSDGKERIIELETKQKELKRFVKAAEEQFQAAKSDYDIQKGKWEKEKENFLTKFSETDLITFTISLKTVKEELQQAEGELQKREKQLQKAREKAEKEQQQVQAMIQEYKLLDSKHEFLAPTLEPQILTEDTLNSLRYEPNRFFKQAQELLTQQKTNVQNLENLLVQQRDKLKDFCSQQIKNSKLRERTMSGLSIYRSYEQIVSFQKRTSETLKHAIQVAEAGMRKEDQEIEQFIHRMYTHVEKLVEELKVIPKKTRVNVEGTWKNIFDFSIPEWNEDEAKQGLRQYIQSLVNRLDSERFLDENGKENNQKVQQEVEQALHSRQLLHIMTKQQELSVVCRKVTNDRSVTSRKYPWKATNNWSGGEKWSKNMTLFLGLLNYIAEKRQDIRPQNKRHRTVIVDNPFGKASSEHVLQPVFFIAEQLGFQILALTAHAEGKFLSDYFPVIYSCRLREVGKSGKQVIKKEKHIRTAYFQDNNPDALQRLGEQQQLELF